MYLVSPVIAEADKILLYVIEEIRRGEQIMRKKRRSRKITRKIAGVFLLLACIGVTVAVTWAFLTATSTEKENIFKGTSGITVEAQEPSWDSGGKEKANNYSPNLDIPKDPFLLNTTEVKTGHEDDSKEYVAIRLTYQINSVNPDTTGDAKWETVSYEKFKKLAEVYSEKTVGVSEAGFNLADSDSDVNTKKWVADTDGKNEIFYYNTVLSGKTDSSDEDETTRLFNSVKIASALTVDTLFQCDKTAHYTMDGATLKTSNHKGLIGFKIVVEGFAVQAYEDENQVSFDTAKTRLKTLIGENPAPTDTPVNP